jgi:hypothetical protein
VLNSPPTGPLAEARSQSGAFMNERDASEAVERLAEDQLRIYRQQPKELISHANREASAIDGYRGRQLLELLQNADDAAKPGTSAHGSISAGSSGGLMWSAVDANCGPQGAQEALLHYP